MTALDPPVRAPAPGAGWMARLAASRRVQSLVAAIPGLRRLARRDGEALFDLVAGFVHAQILWSVVELRLLHRLAEGPRTAEALAAGTGIPARRMAALLDGAVALGLLGKRGGSYRLARKGAAILGVPGLEAMVSHHAVLYRDLADPIALLRGGETELAGFWPYVFGAAAAEDPETARRYSRLMSESQVLVAEETLRRVDLSDAREVLDIGGGTGTFLAALGARHPGPRLHLLDLPAVVAEARATFESAGLTPRARVTAGSFRDSPLPEGADVATLVRVLYDHSDETVLALLAAIHAILPSDGRLVISEPMAGGAAPHRAGDAYFAFYCMAMGTGRARAPAELTAMLRRAGFGHVADAGTTRPFVTHVLIARR